MTRKKALERQNTPFFIAWIPLAAPERNEDSCLFARRRRGYLTFP
jgi:hypothetical protein